MSTEGERLRYFRRRSGLSQADLSHSSGIGQDTISSIETGKHEPRPSTLRKLSTALGVEVWEFFQSEARGNGDAA